MSRLTIFAKGNSDLSESLFSCRAPDARWDGIGEALRSTHPGWKVRVRHETIVRSDMLLAATGEVPAALRHLAIPRPYAIDSQFSTALFEPADAHILSIQSDVANNPIRHRASGALFGGGALRDCPEDTRRWIRSECEPAGLLAPDAAMEAIGGLVARVRERSTGPVLVYNLSSVVPGEMTDLWAGAPDALSTRIKRFNLALIDLAKQCDLLIVDVDRIAARHGAERLKLDGLRLNCAGSRLVAEEVVRLLDRHGCFHDKE